MTFKPSRIPKGSPKPTRKPGPVGDQWRDLLEDFKGRRQVFSNFLCVPCGVPTIKSERCGLLYCIVGWISDSGIDAVVFAVWRLGSAEGSWSFRLQALRAWIGAWNFEQAFSRFSPLINKQELV